MQNASPVMAAVRKQLQSAPLCTCGDTAARRSATQRTAASDDEPTDAGQLD